MKKARKWIISSYLIAYLDIQGQKDKILSLTYPPSTEEEETKAVCVLKDTVDYVVGLRNAFLEFFNAFNRPTGRLDVLTPEQRAKAEQLRHCYAEVRGVSDSIIITVPLSYGTDYCTPLNGIHSAFYGICGIFITALACHQPFRGGVDIGWGVRLPRAKKEVYGSALVKAYFLENKIAQYPRVVIGDSLLTYIRSIETIKADNSNINRAKVVASQCEEFITTDYDRLNILDIIGKGTQSVEGGVDSDLVEKGYTYVVDTHNKLTSAGVIGLSSRYGCLRSYLESKLHLWNIQPCTQKMEGIMELKEQLNKELDELIAQRDKALKDRKALSPVCPVSEDPEYQITDIHKEKIQELRKAQKNVDAIEFKIKAKRREIIHRETNG